MYCKVIVPIPIEKDFIYICPKHITIQKGSIVLVPFGNKKEKIGLVVDIIESKKLFAEIKNIKKIIKVVNNIILKPSLIKFIQWVANYNISPTGMIFKMVIPNQNIINYTEKDYINISSKITKVRLNTQQQKAFNFIKKNLNKNKKTILLEGVTGSGKTEVFFESIEHILNFKLQVLILVPEISLTPQIEKRFVIRFGFKPDIWHSKISESKKRKIWANCFLGNSKIVIGARSSLFLPFKKLGLIVVDEEHDLSYKQEDGVRYHARDMGIVRSAIEKIPIILSTATPSIETYQNVKKKKFEHVFLSKQYSGLDLPIISLIDLNRDKLDKDKWISKKIIEKISDCLSKNEQSLLFLNRRGYSPLTLCGNCGYRYRCENCSSWLVLHNKKNILSCHHCGFFKNLENMCSNCLKIDSLRFIGPGIERVAEEINDYFPKANIEIMSSDNMNTPKKITTIIERIEQKKIDILVGTQILAKGYHFPSLSFVGVLDADAGLTGGDLRASEHTYNLLQQVGGRAGRSSDVGNVYIQTYFYENKIIKSLQKRDRKTFLDQTLFDRKNFNLPPFGSLIALIFSGSSKVEILSFIQNILKRLPNNENISVLGPIEAPLFLLRGRYRYRLLFKGLKKSELNNYIKKLITNFKANYSIKITIDVDPYSFM